MVPFYINDLGFTLELRSPSNFKTTGLVHSWQTLCKMFSRYLTTRVTGFDQPPLQIMQMLYCFVNNIHVDYADLLWEGLHYSLEHPLTLIPYPRFTKLIVSHYMTAFPEISRRARDKYHNLEDDMMVKNIFNSGKHKDGFGMKIPSWMITNEMKLMDNYRIYDAMFRKSHNEVKAKQNVQQVEEHLIAEEIEKLVKGAENVENTEVDSTTLRQNDNQNDPDTRLEPRSNKERPEVEITASEKPVNVIEEEEESAKDDYELRRREKGKHVEESRRRYMYLFEHLKTRFMPRKKFNVLAQHLQEIMEESLPKMDDPHDDAHSKRENDAKRQKTSEHETYMFGESSFGQDYESELGDELQYHIYQMQNFLKNDIVWERKKEILVSPHPQRPTPVVQSYQRDPKARVLSLVNQDLLYLKKRSSTPEKIVMSLHKFPAVSFLDDDIK
nr:hypothetical protein [Tanacetum cinerariifolium]